jgi:hypothetical protein
MVVIGKWRWLAYLMPILGFHRIECKLLLPFEERRKRQCQVMQGQGELTCTLVLAVKAQLLEIVYFWKFDTKFSF